MFFADVLAQDTRERSISARMRMLLAQQSVGRGALRVVVDRAPRLLERQRHVGLRHAKDSNRGEGVVLNEQVEDGVKRVLVPEFGDLSDGLALERQKLRILHHADQDRKSVV